MKRTRDLSCVNWSSVYVIPGGKYVKIGVSNDVKRRWHGFKTSNPYLEKPHFVSPRIRNSLQIEGLCHYMLKRYRVPRSEWFRCSRYMAEVVVRLVLSQFNVEIPCEARPSPKTLHPG